MKYYKVEAKCGHVGRNKYILKNFYIRADNGKEAAKKARDKPRVKHHNKYAIKSVTEINYETFLNGLKSNKNDDYFNVHSPQEQRLSNALNNIKILEEEQIKIYRKKKEGLRIKNAINEEIAKKEERSWFDYE